MTSGEVPGAPVRFPLGKTGLTMSWTGWIIVSVIVLGVGIYLLRRRRSAADAKVETYECTVCNDRDCECRKSDS